MGIFDSLFQPPPEPEKKKYWIGVKEIHYASYTVMADSEEEAIKLFKQGAGDYVDSEYAETIYDDFEIEDY